MLAQLIFFTLFALIYSSAVHGNVRVPGEYEYYGVHDGSEKYRYTNEWLIEAVGGAEVAKQVALDHGYFFVDQGGVQVPGKHEYYGVHDRRYTNEWLIEAAGGAAVAKQVAHDHGYFYVDQVKGFPDVYLLRINDQARHSRTPSPRLTTTLIQDPRVRWSEQLHPMNNVITNVLPTTENIFSNLLTNDSIDEMFNDELWGEQWQFHHNDSTIGNMNLLPVYKMGYSGKGVRVLVVESVDHKHVDLRDNYDPEISWDFTDNDPDPTPEDGESHGTMCAGIIAMTPNNRKCGVGVAWGAKVGGIRINIAAATDLEGGQILNYALDKVDIYSSSWGASDDGVCVAGPGPLTRKAIENGVQKGRGGKGAIYVWPSGNGGGEHDNCNLSGHSSNMYSVSVGIVTKKGHPVWYSEVCSSLLTSVQSWMVTTSLGDTCRKEFHGTSAAVPTAVGIIALVLEANPNVTYRDVQHLIAWTSQPAPLENNPGWVTNSVGLRYNIRFGFGLMNAEGLVKAALNWTNVPEKTICSGEFTITNKSFTTSDRQLPFDFKVTSCSIKYLEFVEVIPVVTFTRRGALEMLLTSPGGTTIELLTARPLDKAPEGFKDWSFKSVATWGENPSGTWTFTLKDMTDENNKGELTGLKLILHGTSERPMHMNKPPEK